MPYAIELYLDDESSTQVEKIQKKFQENGINIDKGTKPHVSLSIYQDIPLESFSKELKSFAKKIRPFEVTFSNIGVFTNDKPIIFLAPKITKKLLNVHTNFHYYFEKFDDSVWDHYRPSKWVPHCTLCMNLTEDMFSKSTKFLRDITFPIEARFEKIGILEFSPNKQLMKYKLG